MILFSSAATPMRPGQILTSVLHSARSGGRPKFESSLAAALGMRSGIALSSLMRNTFAVMDSVKRRCPNGATIVLPRYACPSFIHGIKAAGMPFRYCDIDPESLTVRSSDLMRVADASIGAVLIPNLFGLSADMPSIAALCRQQNWFLLEGADYTLGGSFAGKPLGSFGDYSILNFQEGKAIPIGGGMALCREADAFTHLGSGPTASSVVAIARTIAYSILIRPWTYGMFSRFIARIGMEKKKFSMEDTIRETRNEYDYTVDNSRLNQRISGFQGALGCHLFEAMDAHVAIRNAHAMVLQEALRHTPGVTLIARHPAQDRFHYIRYPILVRHDRRDGLCRHLLQEGFEASPMYVQHGMRIDAASYPGAARVCAELLTLPCHPLMRKRHLQRLASNVREFMATH